MASPRFLLLLHVALVSAIATSSSASSPSAGSVTLYHITDSHDFDDKLTAALKRFTSEAPDQIIHSGDCTELGQPDNLARYKAICDSLPGLNITTAMGNHDQRWNPFAKYAFLQAVGSSRLHWSVRGVHFITLDSNILLEHYGHFQQVQLDWLAGELRGM
jgi:3',5'-cyclic AMP phosphodiesterase CpdA